MEGVKVDGKTEEFILSQMSVTGSQTWPRGTLCTIHVSVTCKEGKPLKSAEPGFLLQDMGWNLMAR